MREDREGGETTYFLQFEGQVLGSDGELGETVFAFGASNDAEARRTARDRLEREKVAENPRLLRQIPLED